MTQRALLIGSGYMAGEYAKVLLDGLHIPFDVAARSRDRLKAFAEKEGAACIFTMDELTPGHITSYEFIIVSSAVESLERVTRMLLEVGARKLLIEKPAALSLKGLACVASLARAKNAFVRIACNRRYYRSVQALRQILEKSPPVAGFFDFTEWAHAHLAPGVSREGLERLGFTNSIHVFDTVAFLLGGSFENLDARVGGQGALPWHPASATFVGSFDCGNTPVSYCTSWLSPGRWNIEILTPAGRYKLSPMETLQLLKHKTVHWEDVAIDDSIDRRFKPGLYHLIRAFLGQGEKPCELPELQETVELMKRIETILGYGRLG